MYAITPSIKIIPMKTAAQTYCREEALSFSPARLTYPSKLFVEVTTRCNLRCPMCTKQSPGCDIVEGDMSTATFDRILPALPKLEALILNGIGEPLLHPSLERLWKKPLPVVSPSPVPVQRSGRSVFQSFVGHVAIDSR